MADLQNIYAEGTSNMSPADIKTHFLVTEDSLKGIYISTEPCSPAINIKIKYFNDITPLDYINGKSDWIDLRAAKTIYLNKGEFSLIPLGVAMELPKGWEAIVAPRSSSFKKWGIIQTNSIGIIDESYCGNDDQWLMPVLATQDTTIYFDDRVCQFRIQEHQPKIRFQTVESLNNVNRDGFGSTGVK